MPDPTTPTQATLSAREAAQLLGRSRSWFYAHQDRLYRSGFPQPIPVVRRWSRDLVMAFIHGTHAAPSTVHTLDQAFGRGPAPKATARAAKPRRTAVDDAFGPPR